MANIHDTGALLGIVSESRSSPSFLAVRNGLARSESNRALPAYNVCTPLLLHRATMSASLGMTVAGGSSAAAAAAMAPSPSATGSTIHTDNEQALAEVELLAQNQRKLGALTNRMTSILAGFDRRLIKLESTMLPIHRGTQNLIRIQENVDAVLHSLNKTLGHYDVVQDEEPILRQG